MATILEQSSVCDGYDVRCLISTGGDGAVTFHFPSPPADVQALVDALEAARLAVVDEPMLEIIEE